VSVTLITGRNCLPKKAARQQSRNSAAKQPTACPRSEMDRGRREKRPVVPLSILPTHWIKERRLCAVKACLLATHSDATCNPGKASDCDAITWAATIGCKTATHCLKTRRDRRFHGTSRYESLSF